MKGCFSIMHKNIGIDSFSDRDMTGHRSTEYGEEPSSS